MCHLAASDDASIIQILSNSLQDGSIQSDEQEMVKQSPTCLLCYLTDLVRVYRTQSCQTWANVEKISISALIRPLLSFWRHRVGRIS